MPSDSPPSEPPKFSDVEINKVNFSHQFIRSHDIQVMYLCLPTLCLPKTGKEPLFANFFLKNFFFGKKPLFANFFLPGKCQAIFDMKFGFEYYFPTKSTSRLF